MTEGARMNPEGSLGLGGEVARLCLAAGVNHLDLACLLSPLLASGKRQVLLDAHRVSRLGTVEFRVLGSFADEFKRHGGFLTLDQVTPPLAALIREYGFTRLLAAERIASPMPD